MALLEGGKLRSVQGGNFAHWCPACRSMHVFYVGTAYINDSGERAQWSFDGNTEFPSFSPSMNIGRGHCHYYLSEGHLQYLDDCRHSMKGQIIQLPAFPSGDSDTDQQEECEDANILP